MTQAPNPSPSPTPKTRFAAVQDVFLNAVRRDRVPVTMFLVNGIKLQGVVTWFDNFCVLLRRESQVQLVYKHAISTILPQDPITLQGSGEDEE